jgi:hypothetical protein
MIKKPVLIVSMMLALGAMATPAHAAPQNVLSTQAYIQDDYALQVAEKASLPAVRTAADGLVSQINSQCPNIMAGAPHNNETADVGWEILGSVLVALSRPEDRANINFAQRVESLRWSSRKLEHTVRSYATQVKAQAKLSMPNLCAALKAWVASGYTTLPASSVHFAEQVDAILTGPGPGKVPLMLFAPYERPDEKTVIHQTKQLEVELNKSQLALLETTLSQISRALGQSS